MKHPRNTSISGLSGMGLRGADEIKHVACVQVTKGMREALAGVWGYERSEVTKDLGSYERRAENLIQQGREAA